MGHPKQQTKTYARPLRPYSKDNLIEERRIMDKYGLRRKKELWRAQEFIRNARRRAMQLQASENPILREEMMKKLYKMGIVSREAEIDDVLDIDVEKFLQRRLQSILYAKGLANTMKHARQMIVHKLVEVDGRKIKQPSFLVSRDLEEKIKLVQKAKKSNAEKTILKEGTEKNNESKSVENKEDKKEKNAEETGAEEKQDKSTEEKQDKSTEEKQDKSTEEK